MQAMSQHKQGRIPEPRGCALQHRKTHRSEHPPMPRNSWGLGQPVLRGFMRRRKPRSPQAIRRSLSCGTIRRILRPRPTQTTMKAWKPHPTIYDGNLVKRDDDNSAINSASRADPSSASKRQVVLAFQTPPFQHMS